VDVGRADVSGGAVGGDAVVTRSCAVVVTVAGVADVVVNRSLGGVVSVGSVAPSQATGHPMSINPIINVTATIRRMFFLRDMSSPFMDGMDVTVTVYR
jgi:hypothetical protein